jgi:predicted TIM-barrel fold metal-dependent hydrolase
MRIDDMVIISVDDHIIEGPDIFDGHMPQKWADQAPRVVTDEQGIDTWVFQDQETRSGSTNAVVTWPKEQWGFDPTTYAEMRPAAYDLDERVRDMNRDGYLASMMFGSMPGFSGNFFLRAPDKDLSLIALKAYNDWHIDELCTSHPGRFIPLAIPPVWDLEQLVAEVRRVAAKGCRAISMPELPYLQGQPSYHSDWWDPFWAACCDAGIAVCLHIGQGFAAVQQAPGVPTDNLMILATQVSMIAAQDILWGPSLRRFPELRIAWSEGGIGWIPFYLDRCDRHYLNQRWLRQDFGGKLPSEVFQEHCLACFITDPSALRLRDRIGIDTIAFEVDYPHSDSLWPDAPEVLMRECANAGCTDEEIDKISWKNAARFFEWDAFEHIPKERATVGALRALAMDVDTTVTPKEEYRRRYELAHAG